MTRLKEDRNAIQEVVELLAHDGFGSLGEAIRRIINEALRLTEKLFWPGLGKMTCLFCHFLLISTGRGCSLRSIRFIRCSF